MSECNITLADAGEREFINRIRKMMPGKGGSIIFSAGDDCLVTESFGNYRSLYTTDTFVDGVHFTRNFFSYGQIGHRCMAASVSDIAAMSGIPMYSLLSLSMPRETLLEDAITLFEGFQKTAEQYGCPVAGGETTSTFGQLTITITVIGKVEPGRVVTRSGAQVGDSIYVTGTVGDAMAGLMAFERDEKGFKMLKKKFLAPEALVSLSRSLSEQYQITAMIDISDGLAVDLGHLCEESGCGAELFVSSLPLSVEYKRFTRKHGIDNIDFALSSGEEFELLFTSNDSSLPEHFTLFNHTITRIGTVTDSAEGMKLHCDNGTIKQITLKGYEHFRS